MNSGNPISFDLVDGALRRIGAAGGTAESHGSLCGLACCLGGDAGAVWVRALAVDAAADDAGVLRDLAAATLAALDEGNMSFTPLLPPDDLPLALRAIGLAEWCAGFMQGLGEAAGSGAVRRALEGEIARELMADFGEISRVTLGDEEGELEAETAYAELVEFVRVGVQLIFEELHCVRAPPALDNMH
jgi:uncharacterized protein YgfB (UPF0149 family)